MTAVYSIYGTVLRADRPIPGLVPLSARRPVDVELHLGSAPPRLQEMLAIPPEPWYVSPYRDARGEPISTGWRLAGGACLRLGYCDGTEFFFERSGRALWATWPPSLTLEATVSYLLGPVMGFLLRLRGVTCLHASAVALGGQAVAFLGPAGAGKSTTAAAFAARGHAVLADDVVALAVRHGAILAQPGYPRLRLWPAALGALAAVGGRWPCLPPDWGARRYHHDLTRNGFRFQQRPLPLAAVYVLEPRRGADAAPLIEAVPAADGLMTLVANTFGNYLLDGAMRAREFAMLGQLLARVPLRRIYSHGDLSSLEAICDLIGDEVQELAPAAICGRNDSW
jgi:hypothetical protein